MAIVIMVHIHGEEPFLADLEELPNPMHSYVLFRNLRKRDGKPLPYIADGATAFLFPWSRISFLEAMGELPDTATARANGAKGTTVLGFFREDGSGS